MNSFESELAVALCKFCPLNYTRRQDEPVLKKIDFMFPYCVAQRPGQEGTFNMFDHKTSVVWEWHAYFNP